MTIRDYIKGRGRLLRVLTFGWFVLPIALIFIFPEKAKTSGILWLAVGYVVMAAIRYAIDLLNSRIIKVTRNARSALLIAAIFSTRLSLATHVRQRHSFQHVNRAAGGSWVLGLCGNRAI
jgi:hypothetical protein